MKYYIIAGEASGDLHGASLIKAIKSSDKNANIRCWGGDLMKNAGGNLIKHYKELSFMGFWEVLINILKIFKNLKFCKIDINNFKPDVIVYIDYPGFNLRIAKWARKNGYKNHYYISPQVWAWQESRVNSMKKNIDSLYVILPFEKAFFEEKHNYRVNYVGHPLMEHIPKITLEYGIISKIGLASNKPIITFLPGSRKQEINKILPELIKIRNQFPKYQFVIAGAPGREMKDYDEILKNCSIPVIFNETYNLIKLSKACVVTSGTATLETALLRTPQIVCYKSSFISYFIARKIVKLKYISLVNIIMNKEVVEELIQSNCNSKKIANSLNKILATSNANQIKNDYEKLYQILDKGGASKITSNLIFESISK
ncbi:MAG: lipid-A-disaccharide synthase [Candidatus Marivariicella framensis]|jgi:lipid-A-disaccharide synthase|tara:strand:- start:479 stop:1591 length:1113 start_codon:yes stop_codon:yes gene_type:complete